MPSPLRRRVIAAGAATAFAATLAIAPFSTAPAATAAVVAAPVSSSAADATLALTPVGSYETGVFDESAAEIVQAWGPACSS